MRRIDLTYRIIKIAHKAVSVAVCALTGMVFMGGAQAATYRLGSTISSPSSTGTTFYTTNVTSYSNGSLLTSVFSDTSTVQTTDGAGSTTQLTGTVRTSNVTANIFGALGVSGGVGAGTDDYVLGTGAIVKALTTGRAAQGQYSFVNYTFTENMDTYPSFGTSSDGEYNDGSVTYVDTRGISDFRGTASYYDGVGFSCPGLGELAVCDSTGSPLTDQDSDHGEKFQLLYNYTTWSSGENGIGAAAASTSGGVAIDTTGSVTLSGNNTIEGTATAGSFIIEGSGIYFNDAVSGPLTYSSAGSATLSGGADLTGNVDFGGFDGALTLSDGSNVTGNIDTSTSRTGTVVFENNSTVTGSLGATSALKEVKVNGTGAVTISGSAKVNTVTLNAAGTIGFGEGVDTRLADTTLGTLTFGNFDGTIQIGGDGSVLYGNVVTDTTINGTLTFVSGSQQMVGQIGSSSKVLKKLNVGGANTSVGLDTSGTVSASVTVDGDIFADSIVFNNNGSTTSSELLLASGHNITSATGITTSDDNMGILTLQGGTQTVTATIGGSGDRVNTVNSGVDSSNATFTGAIYAVNVNNTGSGSSTFNAAVDSTNIDVGSGTSTFQQSVTATTTTIGSGTGNFNTVSGTTSSTNINFDGAGIANFNQGATFTNVDFNGYEGTINVASGKDFSGTSIFSGGSRKGYLNLLGGTQTVSAAVGEDVGTRMLKKVTAGVDDATTNFTSTDQLISETLEVSGTGTVNLSGGLKGTLSYTNNVSGETGTVTVASGKDITGNVTSGLSGGVSQGILTLSGGAQQVTGTIGTSDAPIKTVNVAANSATSTLGGMVYADTVKFSGTGTLLLAGNVGGDPAAEGLVGTLDFDNKTNVAQVADGVNLTTGTGGVSMTNASDSEMQFLGSSTVTGVVGGNTAGRSTLLRITAGATGSTVNFLNDVHVVEAPEPTTFHVSGTGTVNFSGDLYGPLEFNSGADGVVNFANGKSIIVTLSTPAATATVNNEGTINFLGGTTLSGDLGESGTLLKAVNFHTDGEDNVTLNINKNIYATTTTIDNGVGEGTSVANVTGNNLFLGETLTLQNSSVTLNTAGETSLSGSSVTFAHTKNVNGTLTNTALVTQSSIGSGVFTTNGATLGFAVGTQVHGGSGGGLVSSTTTAASSITGSTSSTLVMDGDETVNISLLGSLRNGQTYTLIDVAASGDTNIAGTLNDNSFVIDTALSRNETGDLVLTATRSASGYITKSNTSGHFSNNAATVLGTLARAGTGYTSDMQTVFNKLDLNQWGYGDTEANLAAQVKRLVPVANASISQSGFLMANVTMNAIGNRMAGLRGDTLVASNDLSAGLNASPLKDGFWLKALGSNAKQDQVGAYDGYKTNTYGVAFGVDRMFKPNLTGGVSIAAVGANVDQSNLRDGDSTKIKGVQATLYGSFDVDKKLYIDGALSYASNKYDSVRQTIVGRTALGNYDGVQFGARIGAGYQIDLGNKYTLTPMVSLDYSHLTQDAYTETGAGDIGLRVNEQKLNRLRAALGVRLANEWLSEGTLYRPEITVQSFHDSGSFNKDITAAYIGGGDSFVTSTNQVGKNTVNVGLGLTVATDKVSSVKFKYDFEKRDGFSGHTASITGRWSF
jgi:outer membrane autotransporter protein